MSTKKTFRQLTNSSNTILTVPGIGRMRKIYCKCGRIIGLDSTQVNVKLTLGKELECNTCRNARIAKDIEELNMHFEGIDEIEEE